MPLTIAATGVSTLPDVSVAHSLIQMVIALVVIVGCIWGLGKLLGRIRTKTPSTKRRTPGNGLSVISRQTLGKDLAIATIQWGDREVLVGIAGSTITFLNDARSGEPATQGVEGAEPTFPEAGREETAVLPVARATAPKTHPASLVEVLRNATARR